MIDFYTKSNLDPFGFFEQTHHQKLRWNSRTSSQISDQVNGHGFDTLRDYYTTGGTFKFCIQLDLVAGS